MTDIDLQLSQLWTKYLHDADEWETNLYHSRHEIATQYYDKMTDTLRQINALEARKRALALGLTEIVMVAPCELSPLNLHLTPKEA